MQIEIRASSKTAVHAYNFSVTDYVYFVILSVRQSVYTVCCQQLVDNN